MAQTMCATTTAAATVPSGPTLVLDQLVDEAASLRKTAVAEVMVFCLEQAAHAKELANQLAARCVALHYTPLGRLELACIFCISDILQNLSYSHRCPGATAYRSAFEESCFRACSIGCTAAWWRLERPLGRGASRR
ncbi:unnamed protein product [Effrenium voratum]|nr:unnamed protein product [Effrenium voratum]